MEQVNSASALGWDPDKKKAVSSEAKSHSSDTAASIKEPIYGAKSLMMGYMIRDAEDVVMSPVIRDNSVAKAYANARYAEHDSQFVRASGELGLATRGCWRVQKLTLMMLGSGSAASIILQRRSMYSGEESIRCGLKYPDAIHTRSGTY